MSWVGQVPAAAKREKARPFRASARWARGRWPQEGQQRGTLVCQRPGAVAAFPSSPAPRPLTTDFPDWLNPSEGFVSPSPVIR